MIKLHNASSRNRVMMGSIWLVIIVALVASTHAAFSGLRRRAHFSTRRSPHCHQGTSSHRNSARISRPGRIERPDCHEGQWEVH